MGIYVGTQIHASMAELWARTQDPALHEQWDLRFTGIDYLPALTPDEPRRFRYTTRIGLGLAISGIGETLGERDLADGSRASALQFSSADPRSIIREGSGYWKYQPTSDGIRFVTAYDYRTRFGAPGMLVDRLAFRPLIGWATAWSFDRLRLWLERGVPPAIAARLAVTHGIARLALATVFVWHALIPKLLGRNAAEVSMFRATGLPESSAELALIATGVAELVLAFALLVLWHRRWPPVIAGLFALVTTIVVALTSPAYLGGAFNPVTLNLAVGALAAIDLLTLDDIPSAGRCDRRAPEEARR